MITATDRRSRTFPARGGPAHSLATSAPTGVPQYNTRGPPQNGNIGAERCLIPHALSKSAVTSERGPDAAGQCQHWLSDSQQQQPGRPVLVAAPARQRQMDKGRAALVALVLQNTLLVLTMRYSRTRPGPMYLASTAVIVDEVRSMPPGLGCSHPRSVAALAQPATNPLPQLPLVCGVLTCTTVAWDGGRRLRPPCAWQRSRGSTLSCGASAPAERRLLQVGSEPSSAR